MFISRFTLTTLAIAATSFAFYAIAANAATTATTKSAVSNLKDAAAIRDVGATWKSLYASGRFAEIPDLYTEDTMVMPRGRPVVVGREQMRKAIGGLAAGRRVDIDLTEREIHVTGNHGWIVTDFKVTYTPSTAGAMPVTEHGRSLVIFRKDKDGKWRIHRDMDSPAPHPAVVATVSATVATPTRPVPAVWNPASRTEVTACDRMTASRYDRTRLAPPVARENMDVPAAIKQCEADLQRFPADARILFQLGRIYGYTGDKQKTLLTRQAAAAVGNHNAIFLLGYLDWLAAKDDPARCAAARDMKLAADRGNYSARVTYGSFFSEGKFLACADRATKAEVTAYAAAAKPEADGFFETRLIDHLIWELKDVK